VDDSINVTKYIISYKNNYDSFGRHYYYLTELPAIGASRYSYTIQGIGEGDPSNYFFYVSAGTPIAYNFSKSDTQVAKFTKSLSTGKHLVSLPLILNNTTISNALRTLKLNIAWYYNNTDILDPWKSYNPSKTINDLKIVDPAMALWINVEEKSNMTIAGLVPKTINVTLKAGWNFVGYPSFIKKCISDSLSGIVWNRIEGWDNLPPVNLKLLSPIELMKPGYGYWIKVPSDTWWTVNN